MDLGFGLRQASKLANGNYKLKTKSAVKKRISVNCNGLLKRGQSNKRHLATKKPRKRIRQLGMAATLSGRIRKNILNMLH
jgi:ribosomal protein L35